MIRIRPLFLLVLMVLIPTIIFSGFFGHYLLIQQQRTFDQQLVERAANLATAVDRELSTQVQLLSVLSESPRLDPPISQDRFGEIAARLRVRIAAWDILRVSDLGGNVLATVPPREVKQVNDPTSLLALAASGASVIGTISRGPAGNLGFPVRVPILRDGHAVAALTAVLRPSSISAVLQTNAPAEEVTAWVVDANDVIVGAADPSVPIGEAGRLYARNHGTDNALDEASILTDEMVRIASAPVGTTGWKVSVARPLAAFTALSRKTAAILFASSIATVLVCMVAALMFSREHTQRRQEEQVLAASQRSDALAKLTGQVAHDFNNLLMVFQAATTVISNRPDDKVRVQMVITSMIEAVGRGKEMTERLLSLSRKSNQTAQLVDIVALLREMQPLLRQAANDSITIEHAIDGNLWPAKIEPKSLEIALINLVTNAREAMPDGGCVTIRARNIAEVREENAAMHGPHIAITVMDTGYGIEPANLRRIFEPLFSTKAGGAPGLGLTQVSNFAKRSGGDVAASRILSGGASLTIYLPSALDHVVEKATGIEQELSELPRHVLIVDDTPASLQAARMTFESEGIEVITAKDGEGAIDTLRHRAEIDGLLSDIMMSGMSGIELAGVARRLRPDLKIVLMTGYSDRIEQGLKIDFPVVTKPFARSDICAAFAQSSYRDVLTRTG